METDWKLVKKTTLWDYETLIKKLREVLSYNFIQEHYNHNMKEAAAYCEKLLGYHPKYDRYISQITSVFAELESLKVRNYTDLVSRVETRKKCEELVRKAKLRFQDLIVTINYIFRWVLPFRNVYLKQLVGDSNEAQMGYVKKLSEHNIKFNLDILEHGRTEKQRQKLSKEAEIPEAFILTLVNKADITRLPYMNQKTVNHLYSAGYDTIDKLARVDTDKLRQHMKSYFDKQGTRLGSFIDISGLTQWAKTIPKIVEA